IDRAPCLRGGREGRVDGAGLGDVAMPQQNTADLGGQRFDALFQRIALISETKLSALRPARPGDAPCDRTIVRNPKDAAALAAHQSGRFSHSDPSFDGSLPDSALRAARS